MIRITAEERAEQIRRKLAAGVRIHSSEDMMNTGARRSPGKRAILRRLKELAEERGQTPWPARY